MGKIVGDTPRQRGRVRVWTVDPSLHSCRCPCLRQVLVETMGSDSGLGHILVLPLTCCVTLVK